LTNRLVEKRDTMVRKSLALLALLLLGSSVLANPQPANLPVDSNPAVQVFEGTIPPAGSQGIRSQTDTIDFGAAGVAKVVAKTFTVKNVGTGTVKLVEPIKTPVGFTLMRSFGTATLTPGKSTTFVLALNSAKAGRLGGPVSFGVNTGNIGQFTFAVSGAALGAPSMRVIDNGDPGFRTVGQWANRAARGYQGNVAAHSTGKGANRASWTFTGLKPGLYQVSATWPADPGGATNAQFAIWSGKQAFPAVTVNQQAPPSDFTDAGTTWKNLGTPIFVRSDTVVVQLSDRANGTVVADAVRIDRVGFAGQIIDNGNPGFRTVGTWGKADGAGYQGNSLVSSPDSPATATWTFTGLLPGDYRVSATWAPGANQATNATYSLVDADTELGRVQVNQQQAPKDFTDGGAAWKDLGDLGTLYTVTSGMLVVAVTSDKANGLVSADAVRLERIDNPGASIGVPAAKQAALARINKRLVRGTNLPGGGPGTGVGITPDMIRFLEQCTWGPTEPLLNHIANDLGGSLAAFLAEQMDPNRTAISSYPLYRLVRANGDPYIAIDSALTPNGQWASGGCGQGGDPVPPNCTRDNFQNYQPKVQFFLNAFYGPDQVRQRAAFALHKIIVVSLAGEKDWPSWVLAYLRILDGGGNIYKNTPVSDQRDAPGPFGNFREILYQISRCPSMGDYLDMVNSTATRPNENYAREIMQLFSIGLFELNLDGTQIRDGSGNPIPTYDQSTVNELTNALTGWVFSPAVTLPGNRNNLNYFDFMVPGAANNHASGTKTLLARSPSPALKLDGTPRNPGIKALDPTVDDAIIPGGNARVDLDAALDNIFNHPNVGPFICKNLIQQLVTSNPSPAYVARVASVFNNNGSGVRGDMRAVFQAVWLDPEARGDLIADPNYGKLREPVQHVNNFLRWFDAGGYAHPETDESDGNLAFNNTNFLTPMEQEPLRPPTVFSYFPPDNVAVQSPLLLGPEFAILDTSTVIRKANFFNTMLNPNGGATAYGIAPNGVNTPVGTAVNLSDTYPGYTNWLNLATNDTRNGQDLLDRLNVLLMHNSMSPDMYNSILTAIRAVPSNNPLKRVKVAIYLLVTSSQYQVQR
jgi:uncharacterized protein (DUF1800 family)